MQQRPMRQVVRAKIDLGQAGIHVKGRPAGSAAGRRPASFIAEVDAPSETDALRTMRRALESWGEVPLEPLGRRGKVLTPNPPRRGS
jgi:hypothetical protein